MFGSFRGSGDARVSDGEGPPVSSENRSLKSQPKLKSALSRRGTSKVPTRAGGDRRQPFTLNEPKLNRESPRAGGTQKSTSFALRGPAWVSRTDFFSGAVTFEQSNKIKEFKKPNRFNARRLAGPLGDLIYFPRAGGGQKFRPADRGTGALGARTFSRVCEIFFLPDAWAPKTFAAKFRVGG